MLFSANLMKSVSRAVFGIRWIALFLALAGCTGREPATVSAPLPLIGFTIQVGAFAVFDNAVRLTELLQERGQEATFFRDDNALYKVRFGDFTTREEAGRPGRCKAPGSSTGSTLSPPERESPSVAAILTAVTTGGISRGRAHTFDVYRCGGNEQSRLNFR